MQHYACSKFAVALHVYLSLALDAQTLTFLLWKQTCTRASIAKKPHIEHGLTLTGDSYPLYQYEKAENRSLFTNIEPLFSVKPRSWDEACAERRGQEQAEGILPSWTPAEA